MGEQPQKTTHFGFKDVAEDQKAGMVHGVFTNVASKYDVMNDVMSGGLHRLWKNAMMDWLAPRPDQRLLDVAGGTGDIAFRFLKRAPGADAVVLDMTESMLIEGRKRAEADRLVDHLDWIVGDAMALPFELSLSSEVPAPSSFASATARSTSACWQLCRVKVIWR